MGTALAVIITLAVFIMIAMNKSYVELLIFLGFYLIADLAVVKAFSSTPLIGGIAISVGEPILSILTYAIISLISMGIFFYVIQRYSKVISIITYLVMNLMINLFYMSISENTFLDMIFNLIIGSVIITIYNKSEIFEDVKWFAIVGMIIEAILRFTISGIFF